MSTLSKVFTVLLVIFSIAFTVMTVSFAANSANWRDTALKFQQERDLADSNLRHQIAAGAAQLAAANDALQRQLQRVADLEKSVREKEIALAQLQLDVDRVAAEKSSAEALNRGLVAQLQAAETTRSEYRKQRDELEEQTIELNRRNVDLNERVNELTARIAVLAEQRRQFEQQINLLKQQNEALARSTGATPIGRSMEEPQGAALTGVSAVAPPAQTAIRGKVVDIAGDVVTLSVGSSDGVQPGMVFVVHRGDEYVGDLRIDLVDPERCAGRTLAGGGIARVGDLATDADSMTSLRG
ncbi:MAG: hypothetical protein J5J06_20260 [Phycisphaerae bacterium]|nr:hypothetical protein [Phycisphaerae bacterium]